MRVRVVLCGVAVLLGAYSADLARAASNVTVMGTSLGAVALLSVAGGAAVAVGVLDHAKRPGNRTGPLLALTGMAWFLTVWDAPETGSSLVFSVGLATYAAWPAVLGHLLLAYPSGRLGSWVARCVVGTGYLVTIGGLGLAPSAFFDPATQGCVGCAANQWLVTDRPDLVSQLDDVGVHVGLAWLVAAILLACWRLGRSSPARRRVTAWVSLAGLATLVAVAWWYTHGLDQGQLGTTALDQWLWRTQAVGLTGLAAAVGWGLLRSRREQRALARLVVDLDRAAPPGGLCDALAVKLGDPDLRIAYRVGPDRWVDARSSTAELPTPGGAQVMTTIDLGGSQAALLHRPGLLGSADVVTVLGSAMHLSLENERLHALGLTQLADLRASRVRIIEAGDRRRRSLERDLHDGAQQRLVGVLLAIRLLRGRADEVELRCVEAELRGAIDDLRELARGIFPAVLGDEGLAAALGALSETHHLRLGDVTRGRLPAAVETTAYLVVARAVTTGPVTVDAAASSDRLVLHVQTDSEPSLGDVEDRISALGGTLTRRTAAGGGFRLRVVLPTAQPHPGQAPMSEPLAGAAQPDRPRTSG